MLKIGKLGFDPNNPPPGVWGKFTEGVNLKIRKLTAEVIGAIRKKYTRTEPELDVKTGRMVPVEKVDQEAYNDALTDYLIEDFNGLGDDDGVALPVTLESKKRILNYIPLRDWTWTFAQALDTTEAEQKN